MSNYQAAMEAVLASSGATHDPQCIHCQVYVGDVLDFAYSPVIAIDHRTEEQVIFLPLNN